MNKLASALALLVLVTLFSAPAQSAEVLPVRALGKADAPVTIVEYSSLTCSHCAEFFMGVFPELQKRYIDTGKVRFIYRDFPIDGLSLKAAALAHCMPEAQFFPFVKILYGNAASWMRNPKPESVMMQYAQLGGLTEDKAKACLEDSKVFDALVAMRTEATDKYTIQATPTFIINDGADKIVGAQNIDTFAASIDKLLAKKK